MSYQNPMAGMVPHHNQGTHRMPMHHPYMGGAGGMIPQDMHSQASDTEYSHRNSILGDPNGSSIVSTAFDNVEELVWVGTRTGYVSSHHGPSLNRYTGFRVHSDSPVAQVLPSPPGVYTLTHDQLRLYQRTGQIMHRYMAPDFHDMQCMLHTPNNRLLVGGHHSTVFELDCSTMVAVNKYQVEDVGVAIMRATNRHLLFGDTSGKISMRDPRTLNVENEFRAHSFTLSDFDSYENYIVSCGFSTTNNPMRGGSQIDRHLMLYDMRMLRTVATLQCFIEPYFLRFVPSYTSRVFVVSHSASYQIMDTTASMTSPTGLAHPIDSASGPISAFEVSSTHQHVVFGDEAGCLHIYSSNPRDGGNSVPPFNQFSQDSTFADVVERLPAMSMDDPIASYASVPMSYPGQGALLSDWPSSFCQQVYREPAAIDPAIIANMKMSGNIGYSKAPEGYARYPYQQSSGHDSKHHRGGHHGSRGGRGKGHVPASPIGRGDDPFMSVPKQYRKVEIKYSKLGVEDFDFRHYNRTHFAGLETHIPNAYCNSMLQVLYFIEPLRATLLNHLCQQEFCLACELGFLFHMLDVSKGMTCQASNFLRAFRTIPDASALGLNLGDDDESSKKNLARIIQNWSRFVLQQIHTEISRPPPDTVADSTDHSSGEMTVVQKLFATSNTTSLECRCGITSHRDSETFMYNLIYPEAPVDVPNFEFSKVPFSRVVANSMAASISQQSFCNKCNNYQPHTQKRLLKNVPDVIGLNCQVDNDTTHDFWKRQLDLTAQDSAQNSYAEPVMADPRSSKKKPCRYGQGCTRADCYFYHEGRDDIAGLGGHMVKTDPPAWVPLGLAIKLLPDGQVYVTDIEDPYEGRNTTDDGAVVYELLASVAHIRDAKSGGNLVAHIHVGEPYHQRKEGVTTTQFYLFNDFSIVDIQKKDAVKFNMDWKWPCALFYVRRRFNDSYKIEPKGPFENYESLFSEAALASNRARSVTNIPLLSDEKLVKGDVIGIDAEFVSLNQEESELRSDGTKSTIKPSQMSVARVTCIRGEGEHLDQDLLFKPFMDDYISTQEEVVDYLTQFSGIKPGDLDASLSSKHLTTLKSMYIRLRYMVDKGVIFVGHGLKKDFRVINIVIPPKQVYDTAELFHLHRQRMISLKFLAWYFLGENIQSEMHDSTEDAQTALKLYFKYKSLGTDKEAKPHVLALYDKGRELNWKIPENAPKGVAGIEYRPEVDAGASGDK